MKQIPYCDAVGDVVKAVLDFASVDHYHQLICKYADIQFICSVLSEQTSAVKYICDMYCNIIGHHVLLCFSAVYKGTLCPL